MLDALKNRETYVDILNLKPLPLTNNELQVARDLGAPQVPAIHLAH